MGTYYDLATVLFTLLFINVTNYLCLPAVSVKENHVQSFLVLKIFLTLKVYLNLIAVSKYFLLKSHPYVLWQHRSGEYFGCALIMAKRCLYVGTVSIQARHALYHYFKAEILALAIVLPPCCVISTCAGAAGKGCYSCPIKWG